MDAQLSHTRDLTATEAFFRSAWSVTGVARDRITTDGHDAYPFMGLLAATSSKPDR